MSLPSILTVTETADYLRVSTRTIYALVKAGAIDAVWVRGSIRIPHTSIEAFLSKGGISYEHEHRP